MSEFFFDDFQIGKSFQSGERKVSQEDIQGFADLTGDHNKLHLDEEYAGDTIFKGRISHGLLTLSLALGLWHSLNLTGTTVVAFVKLENVFFKSPVYPGDSISLKSTVLSKRESKSRPDFGLVSWKDQVLNTKRKEIALEYERTFMLKKRNLGS